MTDYEARLERIKRRKQKRKRQLQIRIGMTVAALIILGVAIMVIHSLFFAAKEVAVDPVEVKYIANRPEFEVQLLDINEYSRPGTAIDTVNGIVVHYTANPGTTAQQNHDYFQGLATSGLTYASAQFVIGMEGEIIQCIPCNEIAYASNHRNKDTVSIECCIPDESGKFTEETYNALIHLTTWLMGRYDLRVEDVIRHYDVTGKNCPKYYVENEQAWEQFKQDLINYIDLNGVEKGSEPTE